jgi:hypothetical protein
MTFKKGEPRPAKAGRKPGVPNKATRDIKELAALHGPAIIAGLAIIAKTSKNLPARVAAGKEILDRAYGKSPQNVTADVNVNIALATALDMIKRRGG